LLSVQHRPSKALKKTMLTMLRALLLLAVGASGDRASDLLAQMNLTEKVGLLHGSTSDYTGATTAVERLGIPRLYMNDGPQGFRTSDELAGTTTAFPSGLAVAATFDVAQAAAWGDAMGEEFRGKGADVQLGPGLCVARVPVNGRNFEYASGEDPFLGATMVSHIVPAIQKHGVMANAKHFAANNQETDRASGDMVVDSRAFREIYLPPFKAALEAGALSVMCSYNRITLDNETAWACEHPVTLRELKGDASDVFVMSDWGATHSTEAIVQGLDQEMPASDYFGRRLVNAVEDGSVDQSYVDDAVLRVLRAMDAIGLLNGTKTGSVDANVTSAAHSEVAKHVAANATVLLKNEGALPATCDGLVVVGTSFYTAGGGSGHVDAPATPLSRVLGARCGAVPFFANATGHEAAIGAAATVLVLAGTTSSEGSDRDDLSLGDDDALVASVASLSDSVVVSVSTPGAFLAPWADDVRAILVTWMGGQELAPALAALLLGDANPSGRLPLTLPNAENEVGFTEAQYPGVADPDPPAGCDAPCLRAEYAEKMEVGYRWYDARAVEPKYPFGHGLSYTTFGYSDLEACQARATASVTNTGSVAGAEVAQLYLGFPSGAGEPPQQLKGIAKTPILQPGETATVTFPLTDASFSTWDEAARAWAVAPGTFTVYVGASSRDVRLTATLDL